MEIFASESCLRFVQLSSESPPRFFQVYGDFGGGMKIDSGLIVLLAIVTALVIVALALLFYSPGMVSQYIYLSIYISVYISRYI